MQEGSFRCDANVSVRKPGDKLGTRREIKNLNSFKFMQQAIDYEINSQIDELEEGRAIEQATVLFDPATGETRTMRTKEDAADYRYFPDPDLPPLVVAAEWIERVRATMPELPRATAERYVRDHGLSEYDAAQLTQGAALARYFDDAVNAGAAPKLASNWITGEMARRLNAAEIGIEAAPVKAAQLAQLVTRIADGTLPNNAARQVFEALWSGEGSDVDAIIEAKDLKPMNDAGALDKILDEVIAKNAKNVEEYRGGKEKALNGLVGQVMKASGGKANPAQVTELLKAKLG
ncbi:Aspartyl/glutamyl-tRNA(Asn/Gln) amidotransferase subunit B [compost metagenome]